MSTKEVAYTKDTLKDNHKRFKDLKASAEELRDDVNKRIMAELAELEARSKKSSEKIKRRRRTQALKGEVMDAYAEDDRSSDVVPVDGELKAGTIIYSQNCYSCHSLDVVDKRPMKGPPLGIIYNRRAGSNINFLKYSEGLVKAEFFWSPLNLYKYMADPTSMVPGTTCGLVARPVTS